MMMDVGASDGYIPPQTAEGVTEIEMGERTSTNTNVGGDFGDEDQFQGSRNDQLQASQSASFVASPTDPSWQPPTRPTGKSWKIWAAVVAVLVALLVVMSILLVKSNGETSNSISNSSVNEKIGNDGKDLRDDDMADSSGVSKSGGTEDADADAKNPDTLKLQAVHQYLSSNSISSMDNLMRAGSDQNLASKWIANEGYDVPSVSIDERDGYIYMFRYVLTLMLYTLNGEDFVRDSKFMPKRNICDWKAIFLSLTDGALVRGVICDQSGFPLGIDFDDVMRGGALPTELGKLTMNRYLYLKDNRLTGSVPDELCGMKDLLAIDLGLNRLTGTIPTCIGQWEKLQYLSFKYNGMYGNIPNNEICKMKGMIALHLGHNTFNGQLDSCYKEMQGLVEIFVSNNLLTGPCPDLRSIETLKGIMIDDNMFTGEIDSVFANPPSNISLLTINDNDFSGDLSQLLDVGYTELSGFDMSGNKRITSSSGLPTRIGDLKKVQWIDLGNCNVAGSIPTEIGDATSLSRLALQGNKLTGKVPTEIGKLTSLYHLDLSKNEFSGPIPVEIGELSRLIFLFLGGNSFFDEGPIPDIFDKMTDLRELSLKNAKRNGKIPAKLGNLSNLNLLDLDDNFLSGTVPSVLGELGKLKYLLLNRNLGLSGSIPTEFQNLTSLKVFILDATGLSGDIGGLCDVLDEENGVKNILGDGSYILADCNGPSSLVTCSKECCLCCPQETFGTGCSSPQMANLAIDWDEIYGRRGKTIDFGIDTDQFKPEIMES